MSVEILMPVIESETFWKWKKAYLSKKACLLNGHQTQGWVLVLIWMLWYRSITLSILKWTVRLLVQTIELGVAMNWILSFTQINNTTHIRWNRIDFDWLCQFLLWKALPAPVAHLAAADGDAEADNVSCLFEPGINRLNEITSRCVSFLKPCLCSQQHLNVRSVPFILAFFFFLSCYPSRALLHIFLFLRLF